MLKTSSINAASCTAPNLVSITATAELSSNNFSTVTHYTTMIPAPIVECCINKIDKLDKLNASVSVAGAVKTLFNFLQIGY